MSRYQVSVYRTTGPLVVSCYVRIMALDLLIMPKAVSGADHLIVCLSSPLSRELGTNFPLSQPMVKDCQFGISPVNYSDSDKSGGEVGWGCLF